MTKDTFSYEKINEVSRDMTFEDDGEFYKIYGFPSSQFVWDMERTFKFKNNPKKPMFESMGGIKFRKFFIEDFYFGVQNFLRSAKSDIDFSTLCTVKTNLLTEGWIGKFNFKKKNIDFDMSKLSMFCLTPREYQSRFFEFYKNNYKENSYKGCVLAGGVGSGKTYMGLAVMECRNIDTVIIISPKNAVFDVWVRSISGWRDDLANVDYKSIYNDPKVCWNSVDRGAKEKLLPFPEDCKYFIFNYECLDAAMALIEQRKGHRFGFLIDESHNFNEEDSKRCRSLLRKCRVSNAEDVLWLSATPIKGRSKEVIPMLKSLDHSLDAKSADIMSSTFKEDEGLMLVNNRIGKLSFTVERNEYMTTEEPEEIMLEVEFNENKLSTKKRERFNLPQITEDARKYAMYRKNFLFKEDNKHVKEYGDLLKAYWSVVIKTPEAEASFQEYINTLNKLRNVGDWRACNGLRSFCNEYEEVIEKTLLEDKRYITERFEYEVELFKNEPVAVKRTVESCFKRRFEALVKCVKSPKIQVSSGIDNSFYQKRSIDCFTEMVNHFAIDDVVNERSKKTVIFADNIKPIEKAARVLEKRGIKSVLVHSDTRKKMPIDKALSEFRYNDDVKVLITTFKSMGSSLGLVEADQVILLDQSYRHHVKVQAVGRVDRPGQDNRVRVINLVLKTKGIKNVSERRMEINLQSKEIADTILNSNATVIDFSEKMSA